MKRYAFCSILFVVFLVAPLSPAATIQLTNSTGGGTLDLAFTGDMQFRLVTDPIDTSNIAFINAFLDTVGVDGADADVVDLVGVTAGAPVPPWIYDRTAFRLPSELDEAASSNEYGLVSGDQTLETGGYPPGRATYVHDTLTLQNTGGATYGAVEVKFELGARAPLVFGPGPEFLPFTLAGCGFPGCPPNLLHLGDAESTNSPFVINLIPEPTSIGMLSLGVVGLLRRRGRD